MMNKLFAAAVAALTLGVSLPAAAQDYGRNWAHETRVYSRDYDRDYSREFRGERWRHSRITIVKDGREFSFNHGDRMFYRLLDRPYAFRPGLTYAYTDRCNRYGCVAFVFDRFSRRPIDRIFAPHLQMRGWAWRQTRGFDNEYGRFGAYERDERGWNNEYERWYREDRDLGRLVY